MKLRHILLATLLVALFYGCKKDSSSTPPPGTSLTVTVYNGSSVQSGATVYLFTSKSAWENYVYKGIPSYISYGNTNSNGDAIFGGVTATTYYWAAFLGCSNSINDSASTAGVLTANLANEGTAILKSTQTLSIQNTNIAWPAQITINSRYYGQVSAGNTMIIPYLITGRSYFISSYDPNNGVTQTATITLNTCGGNFSLTTNP